MVNTRILIVDANPDFLESVTVLLARARGVTVVGTARSGEEAIVETEHLRPDLVLMDIDIPGMGGLEATRRIKAHEGAPRLILLALRDSAPLRQAAEAAGANGLLSKLDFTTAISMILPRP